MCDGGKLLPRAVIEVNLAVGFPDVWRIRPSCKNSSRRRCTFDLFELPLRERIWQRVVAIVAEQPGLSRKRDFSALTGTSADERDQRCVAGARVNAVARVNEPVFNGVAATARHDKTSAGNHGIASRRGRTTNGPRLNSISETTVTTPVTPAIFAGVFLMALPQGPKRMSKANLDTKWERPVGRDRYRPVRR